MKNLLLSITLFFPIALSAQNLKLDYKIYDVKKKERVAIEDLIKDMDAANVLFFGEEHNDSVGHCLEAEIYKHLNEKYPKKAILSLEMFHTDVQPVLNEYLSGIISEKNFIKESRAWPNYKDYRPLIEYAKQHGLPVIAANAATRYSNAVTLGGLDVLIGLPKTSKGFLPPLPIDTATGKYLDKFNKTLGGHSMGNMKIYQTQNLWDATMAWFIAQFIKANKDVKVFQINGRFHSDEKLGTLAKLQKYSPKLKILNISAFSDQSFENPDWENFKNLGDYIIITNPKLKISY